MDDYAKTELIRKSVNDVKTRAHAEAVRRMSPSKTYSGVKSKIAGNMKSQKKAKKMGKLVEQNAYVHSQVIAGKHVDVLPGRYTSSPSKMAEMSPERHAQIARKA